MARRDKIHYAICRALEKEGWTIISDPYILRLPDIDVEVDLEAEKAVELQKGNRRILVEIKSFSNISLMPDYYTAAGQYDFYRDNIVALKLEHEIWLAISTVTLYRFLQKKVLLQRYIQKGIQLIIVDLNTETITQWIN